MCDENRFSGEISEIESVSASRFFFVHEVAGHAHDFQPFMRIVPDGCGMISLEWCVTVGYTLRHTVSSLQCLTNANAT